MDDSDDETVNNILRCDFSFPEEHFKGVSAEAKELITKLLQADPCQRWSASACLRSAWLRDRGGGQRPRDHLIPSAHLSTLVRRRLKKLNAVAPISLRSASGSNLRPESFYKK